MLSQVGGHLLHAAEACAHPALLRPGMMLMWGVVFLRDAFGGELLRKFWRRWTRHQTAGGRELLTLERKRQESGGAPSQGVEGYGRLGTATISNPPR